MNSLVFDTLTDTTLREKEALKASVAENISAGIPWLTGVDGE